MESNKSLPPSSAKLASTRRVAWFAECWERLWPLILPLVCVISIFAAISWMGFWPSVSDQTRRIVLGLFAVAGGLAFLPIARFRFPSAQDVNHRIERASKLSHQPIAAQVDTPAKLGTDDNPMAKALWREHQRRMAGSLNDLQPGKPVPKIAKHDPYALRAFVGLLLFIGIVAGWGNFSTRIGDAFRTHTKLATPTGRVDAWVTPPAYTNRPPIFLSRVGLDKSQEGDSAITVPEGSELIIRVLDIANPSLEVLTGERSEQIAINSDADKQKNSAAETKTAKKNKGQTFAVKLQNSSSARLQSDGQLVGEWRFAILPDEDPTIEFVETPKSSSRGVLEFSYKASDDYRVKSAKADIKSNHPGARDAVPLFKAPEIYLPLPGRSSKKGTIKTSQDLMSHPWAGSQVTMTLHAEDDAKQTGQSKPQIFELPERVFTKPLALAVVEERRNLALDVNAAPKVAEMLDIITTTHPEIFIKDISVYTGLRISYRMIRRARGHDELKEAVELMWEIALAIEDGDLSRAERRLRDAQERLSKALENGASDEEIDKLMKELRQAMNEFLDELQEQMAKNQQNQQAMPMDPNAQVLRQQDIDRMMKQIEDLAKSGSKDAARQLLQELQRMMNNLQTAQPGQQQQQQSDEFSKKMDQLGEMMRKQQQLMDQTFDMQRRQQQRQNQQQNNGQQGEQNNQPGGQKPMTPEELAEAMKQLKKQQGELQKQMGELQKGLKELGIDPGKLGEAGKSMGEAEGQLGKGKPGSAAGDQGRALQAMREGAQQMMRNMQNQAGEQGRRGERGQHGQQSRGERDPLGRDSPSNGPQFGDDTKVPDEIDAQRAREILEAIRRRLGEQTRPKLELEYLDRLLPTR